ncbi:MAG: hypothetical protein LUC85_11120 [Bacteroidales bacterium]|nr:hypothetical protein [Bacteroidales bacterium]
MSWKKLILGEKMPDKDDPKYAERREKELEAGRKTCKWLRLDKAAYAIQSFASAKPKLFLSLVFGMVIFCFGYNIYCLARLVGRDPQPKGTATYAVEQRLQEVRQTKALPFNEINQESDESTDTEKD